MYKKCYFFGSAHEVRNGSRQPGHSSWPHCLPHSHTNHCRIAPPSLPATAFQQLKYCLCAFIYHLSDSQTVAFPSCTLVGFLKPTSVHRPSANVPRNGLQGRFSKLSRTGFFQTPPSNGPARLLLEDFAVKFL